MRSILRILLLIACFSTHPVLAQNPHPGLVHYSAKDGLPSSEVYEVLQDREGYIWISTDNGVCRFNGYTFERFGPEQGLTDPVIFYLFEDHRGWIWMYSFQDRVYIYRNGKIDLYEHSDLLASFRKDDHPTGAEWIYVDQEGVFYMSTVGSGIMAIEANGACRDITKDVLYGTIIWTCEDKVFIGNKSTTTLPYLSRIDSLYAAPAEDFVPVTILPTDKTSAPVISWLPSQRYGYGSLFYYLNATIQPSREKVFIQFRDRIETIDIEDGKTIQQIPYAEGTITHFLESKENDFLYLGHKYGNKGLSIYDSRRYLEDLTEIHRPALKILPDKTITHVMEDRQGGVWVASLEDGLYYLNNPALILGYINEPLLSKPVSLSMASADSAWVKTQNHHIYLLHNKANPLEVSLRGEVQAGGYNIHFDRYRQRLWTTVYLNFLENGRWYFPSRYGLTRQISDNVHDHYESFKIEPSNRYKSKIWLFSATAYYHSDFTADQFDFSQKYYLTPLQRIFTILETRNGRVFIGAMEGLYEHSHDGTSQVIRTHPALNSRIEDLAEMTDGSLIIGTKGEGILIWSGDTYLQVSEAQGLASSYIEKVHVDEQGQIWVGTNSGINRIRLQSDQTYELESFTLADGLPSNEITDIASWGGELWVATVEGIFTMPTDQRLSNGPIQPIIEQILVNGETRNAESIKRLKWFEDNLRLSITSLDYPQQGEITYRYRFSPEEEWQTTNNERIEIARLSSGRYAFDLQAQGRNGAWSPSTNLSFQVQNPFWKSFWFWAVLAITLIAGIILYYNRYLRRQAFLQKQERQLLQLESEITDLRQQAYRAQMNPHFVYNCLTAIQSFMLSSGEQQLIASDYLSKFALLTRQALEASRNKTISLADDMKMLENYIQLEQFRFGKRFTYELVIDKSLPIHDIAIPALLSQPYVENAILHGLSDLTYPGHLRIQYLAEDPFLKIVIEDNGIGIFQHQQQKAQTTVYQQHKSAGMDIARKRLLTPQFEHLAGSVDIEEIAELKKVTGTRVVIKIPLDL